MTSAANDPVVPSLTDITKDLQEALVTVQSTKAQAEKAQAALDVARGAWEEAVEVARDLHAEFQHAVAAVVPGVKI